MAPIIKKIIFLWLICCPIYVCSALAAAPAEPLLNAIKPDHKYLRYTGRVDFNNTLAPKLSWPGSSIKAIFTGTLLKITLDDELGKNYYNIIVDDEIYHPYVLKALPGENEYTISTVLENKPHTLEIYKRTDGEEGETAFKRLTINGKLLPLPPRPKRRMEIYGDSITSGAGNEAADNGEDSQLSDKNNYWAYSAIAARELNAELHTISQSGIGIMVSWFPFTMPQYYDQLSAKLNNDTVWDFNQWTPDLVVINLFQNDSWLIDQHKRIQPIPTDAQRIRAYMDFVRSIRSKYPKAQIICALGSMDATANDKWPNYIREAVENLKADGDTQLDTLFFEFTGYGQHPRIAQHKANAKKLANFVRHKMGWK